MCTLIVVVTVAAGILIVAIIAGTRFLLPRSDREKNHSNQNMESANHDVAACDGPSVLPVIIWAACLFLPSLAVLATFLIWRFLGLPVMAGFYMLFWPALGVLVAACAWVVFTPYMPFLTRGGVLILTVASLVIYCFVEIIVVGWISLSETGFEGMM